MKIIIIGAGELGQLLAERLSTSEHDIALIDPSHSGFENVRDKLDVMAVVGDATSVSVLKRAGIENADLLLAVSGDQSSNLLVCQLARRFNVGMTICRVYSQDIFSEEDGVTPEMFGIGKAFSSPVECARHIMDVLRRQCVLEHVEFSNPEAVMVTVRIQEGSPLDGMSLINLPDPELLSNVRFAALVRHRKLRFPHGDTVLDADDKVYVSGKRDYVERFLDFAEPPIVSGRKMVIIGGATQLCELVAREALEEGMEVRVVEPSVRAGERFLERMDGNVRVIAGETTDKDVLREAGIAMCDVFISTSLDDELSILSCIIAKRLGAKKTVSVTHKPEYINIVPEMDVIDSGFNSTVVSVNTVFRLMNEGVIRVDSHLKSFNAYLTEFKIKSSSKLVGQKLKDAHLPKSVVLAMIFRGTEVLAPTGKTELQNGDVVVAIVTPTSEELLKPYFE